MTVQVAVVGCGNWGANLVRVFGEIGALGAVCDTDRERATSVAEERSVPSRAFDDILGDPEIPAVVIATPAEEHAVLTMAALRSGKHVFVEKPLALRVDDAEELVAVAAEHDRILMVGHILQYHPAFRSLCAAVESGRLGRLQYIYSNRLNLGKIRREENVFWSLAPHDISMILSLTGEQPSSVAAYGASYLHNVIADVTNTYLSFPSGVHAHVFVSWLHPYKEQKLVAVGDEGMAVLDDTKRWAEKVQFYPHRISWRNGSPEPERAEGEFLEVREEEPLKVECQHFVTCVAEGRTPRTDGHEALRVLRVLEEAGRLLAERRAGRRGSGERRSGTLPGRAAGRAATAGGSGDDVSVHESAYVDSDCSIGPGTKIWHFSHVLSGCQIGADCVVGQNVMIGPKVRIGDRCKIQNNVSLYEGVSLADGVFCGPSCVFTNVVNPRADVNRKDEFRTTPVGRGATIGANATIICGNSLGDYSFVAAGAVVTEDVADYALVAGVPAERIGWMSPAGERLGADLVCPRSGRRFQETVDGTLVEMSPVAIPEPDAEASG